MFPYNQTAYEQNLENIIQQATGQLQQLRNRPIPTNLTQNFQIAPQTNNPNELQSGYVNSIEEVKNTFMAKDGFFINKSLDTLWFKNIEGKIRTFSLTEVIEKDEKDIEIEKLKKQIKELKESK